MIYCVTCQGVRACRCSEMRGSVCRVYKNFDPRAAVIRQVAEEVFDIQGRDPLIDVAIALEKAARADKYFVDRKLYPNVDFYSGKHLARLYILISLTSQPRTVSELRLQEGAVQVSSTKPWVSPRSTSPCFLLCQELLATLRTGGNPLLTQTQRSSGHSKITRSALSLVF